MPSERVRISEDDLRINLDEQVAFLKASAESYDGGFQGEGKRLAVTLRVLLHNSRSSNALLAQLGQLDSIRFFDSALPNTPGNLLTYSGLVVTAHTKVGAEYLPMLDDKQVGPGEWLLFKRWWETAVFVDDKRREISRKDLVLSLADQDGGAHVDASLNDWYFALTHENSMGWTVTIGTISHPLGPPHLASVRQITHEVLKSLDQTYAKKNPPRNDVLLFSAGAAVTNGGPPRIQPPFLGPRVVVPASVIPRVGRNDPCFCGSGKKFKRCHGK